VFRALVEMQERLEGPGPVELVVEDRPGAVEAIAMEVGTRPATVVSGTMFRKGECRPVLLIRVSAPEAAEIRGGLTTAGHPPLNA
jgi:hypothetical protein